ncbi:MAG: putative holin [Desulfovibrio sp.]
MPESNTPPPENGQPSVTPAAPESATGISERLDALAGKFEAFLEAQVSPTVGPVAGSGSAGTASTSLASRLTPRMLACLFLAGILVAAVAIVSPQQLPVAGYKLMLIAVAGYAGYWIDRWCFPYARPDSFLASADWRANNKPATDRANNPIAPGYEQVFSAAMLRRSLVMLGAMLGLGLGL